jgi:hypothetical protein
MAYLLGGGPLLQRLACVGANGTLGQLAEGDPELGEPLGSAIEWACTFGCRSELVERSCDIGITLAKSRVNIG